MKKTFYFSHDYNARHDPKLLALRRVLGLEGLGAYWCLIEFMYEQGGAITVQQAHDLAYDLQCSHDLLHTVISDFGLFQEDKNDAGFTTIICSSVTKRLMARNEKAEKYRKNARSRWNDANDEQDEKDCNAIALPLQSNGNALKERKGKERKINNEPKNIELSLGEPDHVLSDVLKNLPQVSRLKKQMTPKEAEKLLAEFSRPEIESVLESMENYNGLTKKYSSVYLTAKKWMTLNRERQKTNPHAPATKPTYTDSLQDWFNRTSGQSLL